MADLPAEVSSFVDRRRERADLKKLLRSSRLVTVTGVGGVGKTRIALRVASEVRAGFGDAAWWVDLGALQDSDLLAAVVAQALGLQDQTPRPLEEVLAEYLAARRLLLVFDGCEHLVGACARLANGLLRAAPELRMLVTSRQPLGVPGEQVFSVGPLSVPAAGQCNGARSGDRYRRVSSVELFLERARAADSGFALTDDNRAAVASLCRRLDGIPLAIELAAGRLRALSVQQLVELLDNRFRLLTGGSRTGPVRHETLRAAVGWSHELCTPAERLLWARVSVFPGDFDLTAVEKICTDDQLLPDEVLDLVAGLVDKSILLREDHATGARYRLLDTIREYGQDWLHRLGELPRLAGRHRDYYLWLARRFEAEWCGPDQVTWCRRLNQDLANLRSALDFSLEDPREHRAGLDLVGALHYFWMACGLVREGRHYLERALDPTLDPASDPARSVESADWVLGEAPALTRALWTCAWLAVGQGDLGAVDAWLGLCRTHARRQGDTTARGWIAYIAGIATMFRGDLLRAVELEQEAVDVHRGDGDDGGTGLLLAQAAQSMAYALAGQFERAVLVAEECRASCEQTGERWTRSYADYMLALAEVGCGNPEAATNHGRESLRFKRLLSDNLGMALALDVLASAAAAADEDDRAARLLGIAHQLWHTFGLPQFGAPHLVAAREQCERHARDALGDQAYQAAFQSGLELHIDAGIGYALDEPRSAPVPRQSATWAPLTQRERQIAEHIADGLTNRQIATMLGITQRTVASRVTHILTKLGLADRTQVTAWVTERRRDASELAEPHRPGDGIGVP